MVELADLVGGTLQTVRRITEIVPISVKQAKQAIQRGVEMSIFDGLAFHWLPGERLVGAVARLVCPRPS